MPKKSSDEKDLGYELELGSLKWQLNMLYEQQDELSVLIDRKLEVIGELELDAGFTVDFDEDLPLKFLSKTIH